MTGASCRWFMPQPAAAAWLQRQMQSRSTEVDIVDAGHPDQRLRTGIRNELELHVCYFLVGFADEIAVGALAATWFATMSSLKTT